MDDRVKTAFKNQIPKNNELLHFLEYKLHIYFSSDSRIYGTI